MRIPTALFLFFVTVAPGVAQSFQSWNEVDLTASWRKAKFLVPLLARTDTRLPNPQLAATGITADFPLPLGLTLTGGYLLADLPQRSRFVHLPLVALTKSFQMGRMILADRTRFEKLVGFGTSPVRHRNGFCWTWPSVSRIDGMSSPPTKFSSTFRRRSGTRTDSRQEAVRA